MEQLAEASLAMPYDRLFSQIQKRVADKIRTPVEIHLWGGHVYRLGKGEPAIKIIVKNRHGLAALGK